MLNSIDSFAEMAAPKFFGHKSKLGESRSSHEPREATKTTQR